WRDLGAEQIELFRADMAALRVLPPTDYIGAVETIDEVVAMVGELLERGAAYTVDDPEYPDVYFPVGATAQFGYESNCDRATMEALFAERGGDPERAGKRDPLDALLWRVQRPGGPSRPAPVGRGGPGRALRGSAIARNRIAPGSDVQGGGSDLIFPHHEVSAAHAEAATGERRFARHYVHTGMIELGGEKMSKSLGNLEFVSRLRAEGVDPMVV